MELWKFCSTRGARDPQIELRREYLGIYWQGLREGKQRREIEKSSE
jgi:hypothetical protein